MQIRLSQSLLVIAVSLLGCGGSRHLSESEVQSKDDIEVVSVQRRDQTKLDFSKDPLGYAILRGSAIYRQRPGSSMEIIPIDQVDLSTARRRSTATEDIVNVALISAGGLVLVLFLLGSLEFPSF